MIYFSIQDRKSITEKLSELIEKILFPITKNNLYSGALVALFHYSFIFFITLMILSKDTYMFLLGALCWLGIFIAHGFFRGCIFIRIERHLWNKETWYGPWGVPLYILEKLFKITKHNTKNLLERMYYTFFALIIVIICLRGHNIFKRKYDEVKNTSRKELHLELPQIDSGYRLPNNDPRTLEIEEPKLKYTAL